MPDFAYTARNLQGERVSGVLQAASEREAVAMLAGQTLFPVEVITQQQNKGIRFTRRVNGQTMATLYSQLAALMRSGVPLLRALGVLRDQTSQATLREVLDDVHHRVEDGTTLGDAMARYPRVFSELAVNMVKAGGEGGFMEEALDRVAKFTEQYEDMKSRTAGALAYPIFLMVFGSTIVTVLIVFFVPKFATIFDNLRSRGELPPLTEGLLWFSEVLRTYGVFVLGILGVGLFFLRNQLQTEAGRRRSDTVKLGIPLLGGIFKNLAVARFCRVLGTMLRNGVPILKSLEVSRDAAGNRVLASAIERASENISGGQSLAAPLRSSGHFPVTVVEMIAVGSPGTELEFAL